VRTTVNLDDDVLLAVQERARRERRSVGEVLSELARQALTEGIPTQRIEGRTESRHGFHPLPSRGRPVSNALVDRLREDEPE
jgi:ribbon-helix-helix CopG family protein